MKTINIKNLVIQFDGDGKSPKKEAEQIIDAINRVLKRNFDESQPQIISGGLDVSDVEVIDDES